MKLLERPTAAEPAAVALARTAMARGLAALAAQDTALALRWLERAHRLVPKDPNAELALASARPRVTALIMLTHRIWTGVIGSVVPARIASRMIIACAALRREGRLTLVSRPSSPRACRPPGARPCARSLRRPRRAARSG